MRLPVVVIGGGLTAIDTATEALAYYPLQVEKFLSRYETLVAERGAEPVRAEWNGAEREGAEEFIAHARAIRAEREAAAREGRAPRLAQLIDSWGGVTIAYRRRLVDAPSYTLNHEEVAKAMEEGIRFAEMLTPVAVEVDLFEQAAALRMTRHAAPEIGGHRPEADQHAGEEVVLPARTILVAAGTQPNTVLAREDPEHVALDGRYFRALDEEGHPAEPERVAKPATVRVLTSLSPDGRAVSFWGDLHPSFAGNVVKAMGGTKQGYPVISRMLARRAPAAPGAGRAEGPARRRIARAGGRVERLTPKIVEVVVKAPIAARAFQPGQFYRLQNYASFAPKIDGTTLAMEGLALTGAWIDREAGLLSTIVLEMGGSSDLCALLKPGEPVILMGPTGTPTETPAGETVLLVGGGLGNAVLFSIGAAFRAAGLARPLFRRLQDARGPLPDRRYRARRRQRRVVLRRGAGLRAGPRRRTAPLSATSSPRSRPMARARSGPVEIPLPAGRPHHRDRLRRHDGRGRRSPPRRLEALFPPGAPRDRLDQLADAMHDEGDLRAVPATPLRPGDRHRDGRLLLLQPGPGDGRRRFPDAAPPPRRRTAPRKS